MSKKKKSINYGKFSTKHTRTKTNFLFKNIFLKDRSNKKKHFMSNNVSLKDKNNKNFMSSFRNL